jgi:hypothetical protein
LELLYRLRQFWIALKSAPTAGDLAAIEDHLTPDLMALFLRMQPGEQVHSLSIYHQLQSQGETNRDLLVAALLHDVGKSRYPLRVWERVIVVIARRYFPEKVPKWGEGEPMGWRRAFVVAQQHPDWGADMAQEAGTSRVCVDLIRHHQDRLSKNRQPKSDTIEGELLLRLQVLDNNN